MNKKKLKRTIIIGIVMFYILTSVFMLILEESVHENKFRRTMSDIISKDFVENVAENFSEISVETKTDSDELAKLFMHYYGMRIREYTDFPFSLAIQDREANVTHLSDNYFYWYSWGNDVYVNLDEYLTDEIRKELKEVRKDRYNAVVEELRLYFDGEKYIPVEVDFRGQGNFYKDYKKTIKFTDYESNKTIVNNPMGMRVMLRELETEFYNRTYFSELEAMLKEEYSRFKGEPNENFGKYFGGFGYSGGGGEYCLNADIPIGDGYRVYLAFRYSSYLTTFFSGDFQTTMMLLTILFSVAGLIFYIMCMRVIEKSEKLDEAKSTFISAASHELKTPLAVIQNQCECIMEKVAPEKNDDYVKSIYDEALRMNGIVSSLLSYNKISQMTDVKKEKCNLSELVKEEVKSYRKFAESGGATIEENIADNIYIDCNIQLMKMAIGNYISNAVKHSVGDKTIKVSLSKHNGVFTFEVVNPADKSSVDIAQNAWSEFSKGDKSRQRQGTSIGMGLPICKKIFELHSFKGYCKYNDGKVSFVITGT